MRNPKELFQARIDIVNVVAQTILLELQASGGRGYLKMILQASAAVGKKRHFCPLLRQVRYS